MNPASDACYDRLREIGVSVETADALAPILAELPPRKREAFYLWTSGMPERSIAKSLRMSRKTIWAMLQMLCKEAKSL
jgi:DNA-directed RNA polymerase specialized sigma24 family protein